jgi:hypothetical protein
MGVVMEHRGGANDGRSEPEPIMGGRDRRSPKIGKTLRASVLGV